MKILFITSLYIPHTGGIETMVRELSELYIKKGFEVKILTKKWPKELPEYENIEGVNVYRVLSAKSQNDFFALIDWIKNNEKKIKADIIHTIGIRRPLPLIGLLLSKKWNIPIINTIAGGDIPDKIDPNPGLIWEEGKDFIPEVLKQSDAVNAVSSYLARDLLEIIPELTNLKTLYAGINFSQIQSIKPKNLNYKYIFSLRRLDPSKGIHLSIEAFNLIKNRYPKLRFIIAGEGSEEVNLKKLVKKLNLTKEIKFIGTLPLDEGIAMLKSAELTMVPSLSEGGGLVNVEAQAAGCPVIASKVGGIPEYVKDNYSGLLFKTNDVNDLTEKITKILDNQKLRFKLIDGGYKYSKKFDWEHLLPQYIRLYKSLIKNHESKPFIPWSDLSKDLWLKLNS